MKNKRLTIDIDEKLHRDFKSVAAQYGVTMKDLIMSFIIEITNLKVEGGIKEEIRIVLRKKYEA